MRTRRSIDDIIGSELRNRPSAGRTRKKRAKVPCYCNDCNGKLVLTLVEVRPLGQNSTRSNIGRMAI
jgi:hypothetical protein